MLADWDGGGGAAACTLKDCYDIIGQLRHLLLSSLFDQPCFKGALLETLAGPASSQTYLEGGGGLEIGAGQVLGGGGGASVVKVLTWATSL